MGTDNGQGYQYNTTFNIEVVIEEQCTPIAYGFTPSIPSNYDVSLD